MSLQASLSLEGGVEKVIKDIEAGNGLNLDGKTGNDWC